MIPSLRRSPGLRRTAFGPKAKSDSLLTLWGKVVKTRDKFTCQKCGRQAPQWKIDAAHIMGRGACPRLKYEPRNGIALCFVHHRWYDTHRGYNGESEKWVFEKLGKEVYDWLLLQTVMAPKIDRAFSRTVLRETLARLEEKS